MFFCGLIIIGIKFYYKYHGSKMVSKTMVNLWLPWFNYNNHVFLVLFVVKPWLIFIRAVLK